MKKIKRLYTKTDNFTEPIVLSTDLDTIDISSTLQTKLTEKGITAENFEEAIIAMLDNTNSGGIKVIASTTEPENMNPGDVWIKTVPVGGDLANATVTLNAGIFIMDGEEKTVEIIECYIGEKENSALDYIDISGITSASSVGAYIITITGKQPFYGEKSLSWTIINKPSGGGGGGG